MAAYRMHISYLRKLAATSRTSYPHTQIAVP